jgi:hypothetical protein
MLAIHSETSRALSRRDTPSRATAAGEYEFTGLLGGRSHVIVARLTGLFCQLEPDGLPRLFLSDRGPIDCIFTRSDILDLEGDDIAATQPGALTILMNREGFQHDERWIAFVAGMYPSAEGRGRT